MTPARQAHLIDVAQLLEAGGPVAFVQGWLRREAGSKRWRRKQRSRTQGDLFGWADRHPSPDRPAAPEPKPPRQDRAP